MTNGHLSFMQMLGDLKPIYIISNKKSSRLGGDIKIGVGN